MHAKKWILVEMRFFSLSWSDRYYTNINKNRKNFSTSEVCRAEKGEKENLQ